MPAINEIYGSRFKGQSSDTTWYVTISDDYQTSLPTPLGWDYEFTSRDGFKLNYNATTRDLFDPIKTSNLSFTWFVDSSGETKLDAIFDTNFDINWYVQVWKNNDLYWWGYLQENKNVRENKYYPYQWAFEALDTLALFQDVKIWDHYDLIPVNLGVPGQAIKSSVFRFGEIRLRNPFTAYPKEWPSIIEVVYSLLYDLDVDVPGTLESYTFWRQLPTSFFDADDWPRWTTVPIWLLLYSDYPPTKTLYPVSVSTFRSVGDILRDLLGLFGFRIFQVDGTYVLTQPELYGSGLTITPRQYTKNPNDPTYSAHPTYTGQGTSLSSVEYMTSPTKILGGNSTWEKLPGKFVTTINGKGGFMLANTFDQRYTRTKTDETNNLSSQSLKEQAISTNFPNDIIYGPYSSPSTGLPLSQTFNVPSGIAYQDTYTRNVVQRSEYRDGSRLIFSGSFKDKDYKFLYGITYDSVNYAPNEITFDANLERWSGTWIEVRKSQTNFDEVYSYPIDVEGDATDIMIYLLAKQGIRWP